jgi:ribosomal protein S18 acetylase RimI-like enzyme
MPLTVYPKEIPLKGGMKVVIRPLEKGDHDRLFDFFQALPPEAKMYLRHDVTDPSVVREWATKIDLDRVIPLVALDGETIVADGTLHIATHGWMQHVGHLRLVVAPKYQRTGLGTVLAHELVEIAQHKGLEKLQAHVIESNAGALRMFERVGFERAAVLPDLVKDRHGQNQNLVVMVNDVERLSQIMEDWIQDTMLPSLRGSGEGYGPVA